jgi:hypothetical protein
MLSEKNERRYTEQIRKNSFIDRIELCRWFIGGFLSFFRSKIGTHSIQG